METHVVDLTLAEAYLSPDDLNIIDTLLKTNFENLEQVSKVRAINPAECLEFSTHYSRRDRQEAWLAIVDPKYITEPVEPSPDPRYLEKPEMIGAMMKLKEENGVHDYPYN